MTLLLINLVDFLRETDPDDRVVVWSPVLTEGTDGFVRPRVTTIPLSDGVGQRELEPGPLMIQIQCRALAETRPRKVNVPDQESISLLDLYQRHGIDLNPPLIPETNQPADAEGGTEPSVDPAHDTAESRRTAVRARLAGGHREESPGSRARAVTDVRGTRVTAAGSDTSISHRKRWVAFATVIIGIIALMVALGTVSTESADPPPPPPALPTGPEAEHFLASPYVDARADGLWNITTSDQDAAPILNAAADRAREAKRPLYIPAPRAEIPTDDGASGFSIFSTVDLRGLDVYSDANIVVRHTDDVGVIVGDSSNLRHGRTIRLASVKHADVGYFDHEWEHPAIRVMGLMGGRLTVNNASLLELYADDSVLDDSSVAYNEIRTQRVNHLRLLGTGDGWINENTFYGGSFNRITVTGPYSHDSNTWHKPSLEGDHVLVDFQTGHHNLIENARSEGGAKVRFSESADRNTVIALYLDNPALLHGGFVVDEDLGMENTVTSVASRQHTPQTLFSLSSETLLTDVASSVARIDGESSGPEPTLPGGKLRLPDNQTPWIDTGLLPLESASMGGADVPNNTMSPPSRVERFSISSDQEALRPEVYLYDANGQPMSNDTESMLLYAGWEKSSDGVKYDTAAFIAGLPILITNPDARYIRIVVRSGPLPDEKRLVSHVTLTAYVPEGNVPGVVDRMKQAIHRPPFATSRPTKGLAWPGTVVQGPDGAWRSVARVDTAVESSGGPTDITLKDATGMAVGDVIGVLQTDGTTHWTSIKELDGQRISLAEELPAGTRADAPVGTTRWTDE